MPQDEGQMPSEDEDFDVTSDVLKSDSETAVSVEDKPTEVDQATQTDPVSETTDEPSVPESDNGQAVEVIQPLAESSSEPTAPEPKDEPVITLAPTKPVVRPDVDP